MKLLLYSHAFAPSIGGVETIVRLLASGLARRGVEVTVATPTPGRGTDDSKFPFPVVRLPGLWQLVRLIRKADVVHLAGPALAPLALGLLLRKPVVVEHHGFQSICPNGVLTYEPDRVLCPGHFMAGHYRECLRCNASAGKLASLKLWALTFPRRWLCRAVSANVAPTKWVAEQLALPQTIVIYHGLSGVRVPTAGNAAPPAPTTFVFIGRLVSGKGAAVVVAAAGRLKAERLSFRLNLIGDGPERASLEALARGLGIEDEVRFLGSFAGGAPEEAMMTASALLMPSLTGETFGLVVLENMLRGKLVVVSGIGALGEVIGDAGLICPPGDVEAWAVSMRRVIENPALGVELGRRARARALEIFGDSEMVGCHMELYRSCLEGRGSSGGARREARGATS